MKAQKIDIENWDRKEAFKHYQAFQNPYFNLTAPLNIGALYNYCKEKGQSLYFTYLFLATKVMNEIHEFHYRIQDDDVLWYERVDCAPTVLSADKKLLFSHLDFIDDEKTFVLNSQKVTEEVLSSGVLDAGNRLNVIYATAIPWVSFTSVRHPFYREGGNGVPLLAFGKIYSLAGEKMIPVSLDVHHALMDGYHAGMFFEKLEAYFTQPHTISTPKR